MSTFTELMRGAPLFNVFSRRLLELLRSKEVIATIMMLIMGILLFSNLKIKGLDTISPSGQEFVTIKKQKTLNIQEIIGKNRNYKYPQAEFGFFMKSLDFFENHSMYLAEKKILETLPDRLAMKARLYIRAVLKISQIHQVDPIWVLSVMWTESHFEYSAKSWAGARGLMQIMPDTKLFIYNLYKAEGETPLTEQEDFNISEYFPYGLDYTNQKVFSEKLMNIELGIIYLKKLLNSFRSHKYATVAYNMGPGWTRGRLRKNLPVGQRNEYLDKVRKAYFNISKKI